MVNPWFIEFWDVLNFDAIERLGVEFGELPISFAFPWGLSVMRVEGTHTHSLLASRAYKKSQDEKKKKQEVEGVEFVGKSGGVVFKGHKPREYSEYEKELARQHAR